MKSKKKSTRQNAGSGRLPPDRLGAAVGTLTGEARQDGSDPFRSLFAASLDAVLLTTPDGRILAANAAACRMFGYSEQELIAAGRSLVVDGSDPQLAAALQERARTGKFHGELMLVRKDGTKFPGELSSAVFTDREGRQFTSMVIRDVTERKRAEKALTFLRHSIDHAVDTMVCVDREGRFVDVSENACLVLGYSREEFLSKTVHDTDPDFPAEVWPGFWEKLKQSGSLRFESRHRTKEGRVYPVEIAATYFEYEGKEYHCAVARDITERKWTEAALRESEQKFRTIFDSASDGMFLADLETRRIVTCNAACSAMLGYTQAELRRLDVSDLHPPEQVPYVLEQFAEFARGGTGARHDIEFRRKDGTILFTDLSPALITLVGRKAILVVIKDITERKRTEAALRESEQRYRTLFERTLNPILVIDTEGDYVDCNEAALHFLESARDELLAKNVQDFIPPGKEAQVLGKHKPLWRDAGTVETEYYIHGKTKFLELAITPAVWHGKPMVFGIGRDITERQQAEAALRESEATYRELADSITDVFFAFDKDLRCTYWNKASEKLTGIPAEDAVGKSLYDVFPDTPQTREAESVYLDVLRTRQGQTFTNKYRLGGNDYFFEISAYPSRRGLSVFVKDVTERNRAEDAMRQSREQLRALSARVERLREEERTRISREIHDQLGQLVTALKMDLRAIERKLPTLGGGPAGAELAGKLSGAVRLSDDLIEKMHDMAAELRPGLLDNLGLVAAMHEEARRFRARTDVACALSVAEPFPPVDMPTSTALYRILQEILANVARHAQATSVEIRLAEAQGALLLEVHDNGKGISAAALADPKSLGLLGVRERAAALGGSVEISGEPGRGTTVTVRMGGSRGAEGQRGGGAEGRG